MGIALLTAGDRLNRNTGPSAVAELTYGFWTKLAAPLPAASTRCLQRLTATSARKMEVTLVPLSISAANVVLGFDLTGSALVTSVATVVSLTFETWYHIAVVYKNAIGPPGKMATLYVDAVERASISYTGAVSFVFSSEALGYATEFAANPANLSVAYYRSWANALTAAELAIERRSNIAIKTDKTILLSDTPLTARNNLQDVSGYQNHWSLLGGSDDPGPFLSPWQINHFSLTPTAESHLGGRLT